MRNLLRTAVATVSVALLPAAAGATEVHAFLLALQARTPTSVWDMVVGGTLPTQIVLSILGME